MYPKIRMARHRFCKSADRWLISRDRQREEKYSYVEKGGWVEEENPQTSRRQKKRYFKCNTLVLT